MAAATHKFGISDFDDSLRELGWKVADFCRQAGVHRNTVSRWRNDPEAEIPRWVPNYLGMALEVKRLHDRFVIPPKGEPDKEDSDA